jgi:hypothetical protein
MSSSNSRDGELGAFLKARRTELSPAEVGLPDSAGRRRVKGLRREEVALLASISPDYYTRLEQGRRQASEPVLDTSSRVSSGSMTVSVPTCSNFGSGRRPAASAHHAEGPAAAAAPPG